LERLASSRGRRGPRLALVLALAALGGPACRTGHRFLSGEEDPRAKATLSGTVRGPEESAPVVGRRVEAIAVRGGRRFVTRTGVNGGFTLLLPPGRYRLEVALASVESVVAQPDVLDLDPGSVVAGIDVVLGGAGLAAAPGESG
jgi:hypothetical protein